MVEPRLSGLVGRSSVVARQLAQDSIVVGTTFQSEVTFAIETIEETAAGFDVTVSIEVQTVTDPGLSPIVQAFVASDGVTQQTEQLAMDPGDRVERTFSYASSNYVEAVLQVVDTDQSVTLTVGEPPPFCGTLTVEPESAENEPPVALFSVTPNELSVIVDATGSSDPDGTIESYAWDFGDGATGSGVTANHTYAAAGEYTISLTVTDDQGETDTNTQRATVWEPGSGQGAFCGTLTVEPEPTNGGGNGGGTGGQTSIVVLAAVALVIALVIVQTQR